ncbi:MAG: ABC transporter permease [Actinomycetota bacterium]|nr:ABC transporter permease [Actinomycetota bacterium]MDD5666198.1 ABC transporter permease [Actinomycetota bacterium]
MEDACAPGNTRSPSWLARLGIGIYITWLRDVKRFFRDRIRLVGAFAQPLIYLFILGTGLESAFQAFGSGETKYVTYMFPGILCMTVLFTSMFSAISIIWDREFGFLKEMLVAPIPRSSLAVGKVFGGATTAIMQGFILLLFMPLVGIPFDIGKILLMLLVMFLLSISLTSFGVAFAARMHSMEAFPIIMNFVLLPMFFLSGAMFPLQGLPGWMTVLTKINPMSYAVDAVRGVALRGIEITSTAAFSLPEVPAGLASNPEFVNWIANAKAALPQPAQMQVQYYPLSLSLLIVVAFGIFLMTIAVVQFNRQD